MGNYRCEVHGVCWSTSVSPAVQRAVIDGERWQRRDLVRIRVEFHRDQEPRARIWLDRASFGDRDEELVQERVAMEAASAGLCSECLADWLRVCGVDNSYSLAELRFVRLEEMFERELRPRLEPSLDALGWGSKSFLTRRGYPFTAETESARVEVRDLGDHLVAAVARAPAGAAFPGALRIDLVDGDLEADGLAAAAAWADAVARALA